MSDFRPESQNERATEREPDASELPERPALLWLLAFAPTVWAVHFLACYVPAAIWCAKFGTLGRLPIYIAVVTVLALLAIGWTGWGGWRRHSVGTSEAVPHDFDAPISRHRFLGFATALLSGLSAVATLFTAAAFLFAGVCE
ncbi:hypothetical protein [Alienimonas californiensis]|uniref:Uncharacterized protein n=1 Tax=Alienimonas californiensis TaxID=2527989 RepID=A0A517PA26_9PLAN|nr:hypothetical protein [Alienimonas californiensis]QDT16215.1 hypothetical protein CA12_23150 [Alienimonas californiensis]